MAEREGYYDHRADHVVCKRCGSMVSALALHMDAHDEWHALERRSIGMAHQHGTAARVAEPSDGCKGDAK